MIIAIIGILAAIALPAYQDYISRSQVTRVVGELAAAKTAVDAALFDGKVPVLGSTNSGTSVVSIGLAAGTQTSTASYNKNSNPIRSNLIGKLVITGFAENNGKIADAGAITATLGNNAGTGIAGATVSQDRADTGIWTCKVSKGGAGNGWKDKFIPTGCVKA